MKIDSQREINQEIKKSSLALSVINNFKAPIT